MLLTGVTMTKKTSKIVLHIVLLPNTYPTHPLPNTLHRWKEIWYKTTKEAEQTSLHLLPTKDWYFTDEIF